MDIASSLYLSEKSLYMIYVKTFIQFSIVLFTSITIYSQKIELFSFNAGGDFILKNSKTIMTSTMGDIFIKTIKQSSNTLTQGFQQPLNLFSTKIEVIQGDFVGLKVYPNPAENYTNILFDKPIRDQTYLTLVSTNGSILKEISLMKGTLEYSLILNELPMGEYYILLSSNQNINTFKFLKF